jgi:hypothetical protein
MTKDSLEVGKLADLIILDKNPIKVDQMRIKDIRVVETIKEEAVSSDTSSDTCPNSSGEWRKTPGSNPSVPTTQKLDSRVVRASPIEQESLFGGTQPTTISSRSTTKPASL